MGAHRCDPSKLVFSLQASTKARLEQLVGAIQSFDPGAAVNVFQDTEPEVHVTPARDKDDFDILASNLSTAWSTGTEGSMAF